MSILDDAELLTWDRSDPVFEDADGWWFFLEDWCNVDGPYPTEEIAREALEHYCETVLGWPQN